MRHIRVAGPGQCSNGLRRALTGIRYDYKISYFSTTVPARSNAQKEGFGTTPAVTAVRKGAILVVECVEIRSFLHFLLTRAGLNVLEAEPECGGQMLAEHSADVELIIANRPEQFVACGIPIIYIAAIPDAEMRKHCAQVLPKPFQPADLLFQIERLIGNAEVCSVRLVGPQLRNVLVRNLAAHREAH